MAARVRAFASARAAWEKSGKSPRWTIARRAMSFRIFLPAGARLSFTRDLPFHDEGPEGTTVSSARSPS